MQAKGWLKIPGVQDGDRTLEEQMLGLTPALAETPGKTVLDLGCAEGSIALEFSHAGARSVDGYDLNAPFVEVAKQQLAAGQRKHSGLIAVKFRHADISQMIERGGAIKKYDIVLALAILHKLPDPAAAIRFCALSAKSLLVIRLPFGSVGTIRSKHIKHQRADIREILPACGFVRERKEIGPRGEWVHYYRRT